MLINISILLLFIPFLIYPQINNEYNQNNYSLVYKKDISYYKVNSLDQNSNNSTNKFYKKKYRKYLNIFCTLGFPPIKLGLGIGYLWDKRIEMYLEGELMYLPLTFSSRALNLGLRYFLTKNQSIFTTFEIGVNSEKNKKKQTILGGIAEIGIGNLWFKNRIYYLQYKIKSDVIFSKGEKPRFLPGVDLSIGIIIN